MTDSSREKRYGLLGRRLGHSLSPRIHGLIFLHTELDGRYELFETEPGGAVDFVASMRDSGLAGLNVTIPYKQAVLPALGRLSAEARATGAVNTVAPERDGLAGYNTDVYGFTRMLRAAGIETAGRSALILGAGGSARAAVRALREGGASVALVSRNPREAAGRFGDAPVLGYGDLRPGRGWDLLVNCTPVGMYPDGEGCPLEEALIEGFGAVADLVYNPAETRLLAAARRSGARCADGLYMLVAQAVRAQEIWNGVRLPAGTADAVYRRMQAPPLGNVVLIGMPGSGKTTVGRLLAAACGRTFVDLDALVEAEGETIPALFARSEEAFRRRETAAARRAAAAEGAVIATGGGIVTRTENMRALAKNGVIVFLDRPAEAIAADVDWASRPLLAGGPDALRELYRRRIGLYRQYADWIIDNGGDPGRAANDILNRMKEA